MDAHFRGHDNFCQLSTTRIFIYIVDDFSLFIFNFELNMGFNCGIVGLPNGGSRRFSRITAAGAEAANYPFCTIDPNVESSPFPIPVLTAWSISTTLPKIILLRSNL